MQGGYSRRELERSSPSPKGEVRSGEDNWGDKYNTTGVRRNDDD